MIETVYIRSSEQSANAVKNTHSVVLSKGLLQNYTTIHLFHFKILP